MVHFFDADIAKKYGVNAAVLACFLWDCTEQKSAESPQLHAPLFKEYESSTGFFEFIASAILIPVVLEWISSKTPKQQK